MNPIQGYSGNTIPLADAGDYYPTDNAEAALQTVGAKIAALEGLAVRRYGVLWDGVNAACTRIYDAAGITVTTTNFGHFGAANTNKANPFDVLYPWSGRKVINVDMAAYADIMANGGALEDCIAAYYGDVDFAWDGSNGPVMVYTPEFWVRDSAYGAAGREIVIADGALSGYTDVPAHIGGRWFGVDDGAGGLTSMPGMPLTSVTLSSLHSRAGVVGMTLEDIYTYSADTVLMVVEYAKMETQTAIGKGDDSCYRQSGDKCSIAATGAEYVIVTNAVAAYFRVGAQLDVGTSDGGNQTARKIVTSITDHDGSNKRLNFSGAVTTTTDSYVSCHGMTNTTDSALGNDSGYIGTNGYDHAYYRGQIFHAGRHRYVLGAYRQTGTGRIWVAANRAACDAYDALNTGAHVDTGLALPQGVDGAAGGGYISALGQHAELPIAPFCTAIGGSSAAPVGDYCYWPTLATGNTVLIAGGNAFSGTYAGRLCGYWSSTAGSSNWYIAAVPCLKSP